MPISTGIVVHGCSRSKVLEDWPNMAIDVICPDCDTAHKVKDEAAGKKLKCKGCQKVIPIPEATEADPWETLDENEGGEELPPIVRQAPAKKKKTGKKARSSSDGGMPIAIIMSIVINSVQIAFFVLGMIVNLLSGNIGGAFGGVIRIAIDVTIILGLKNRQNRLRWNAIFLDILGLACAVLCGGVLLVASGQGAANLPQNPFAGPEAAILIGAVVLQIVLWITDLVLLFTPAARDWCNE